MWLWVTRWTFDTTFCWDRPRRDCGRDELANDSLDNSKQIVENFEVKVNELNDEFTEFQKNRILTTQASAYNRFSCWATKTSRWTKAVVHQGALRGLAGQLRRQFAHQNHKHAAGLRETAVPGVAAELRGRGHQTVANHSGQNFVTIQQSENHLSSVYIDINQHLDCLVVESPFFNVNDDPSSRTSRWTRP